MQYQRTIFNNIITQCFFGKAIIIYGPRQVGKTTLTKQIVDHFTDRQTISFNGDLLDTQELLQPSLTILQGLISQYDIIVIDEAQRITNIGLIIKIIVDNFPEKQVIATGSSSFDLANKVVEPLTGRAFIYHLYPLSWEEIDGSSPSSTIQREQRLIYGSYPDIINPKGQHPQAYLANLVDNYLYKDVLSFEGVKKHHLIIKILQALALQIGSEVSYTELAQTVGADKETVAKYIVILEQAFIIFQLKPLHTNQRREIKFNKKIYFRDLGVRNALINNFNPLTLRADVGGLRENMCILERLKYLSYHQIFHKPYFWRNGVIAEIDYIEQHGTQYDAFECKYSAKKGASLPASFKKIYSQHSFAVINSSNIDSFIKG